ncbi:hypothetical protein KY333_01975 [Candidatus Woesearchaeota archaeon]|nr:hypothetical protein [Candidatus Woesearchaeota archaeon]
MDVEKLKKMNELSKELKKHGMADSTSQAFTQAGEMVRDETFKQVIEPNTSSQKTTEFDNQYQIMLERQNRQIVQEVQALKETIAAMQAEIEMLKADRKAAPMPQQEKPKQEAQTKFPQKSESKEHPKQGGFTPEDVAVDKVFYFGKK